MFETVRVVVVTACDAGKSGRGEAVGVYYHGDLGDRLAAQIEQAVPEIEKGIDRNELRKLLPCGGARNAVDCALWDLEAKLLGRPVWQLAGLMPSHPLTTVFTCGAEAPKAVGDLAASFRDAKALKLKLNGDGLDADRVESVRQQRPDAWIGVDANQAFDRASLSTLMPKLVQCDVALIEQPFPIGKDAWLDDLLTPLSIAADESVQGLNDLEGLHRRYDVVNIKLDKCGGLTEALLMAARCRELGLGIMVGNMGGTSLGMAAGYILGQLCSVVDLDGPFSLVEDRLVDGPFHEGWISVPSTLWGSPV